MKKISTVRYKSVSMEKAINNIYDIIMTLYIFCHIALGWIAKYTLFRRLCTLLYIMISIVLFIYNYKKRRKLSIRYPFFWMLFFGVVCVVSTLGSAELSNSFKNVCRIALDFFLVFILDYRIKNIDDLNSLSVHVVLAAALSGGYVLIASLESILNGGYGRLGITPEWGNITNLLSHLCAFSVIFNLKNIMDSMKTKKGKTIFYLIIEVLLLYVVIRTGARTGVIIVAMGLFVYFFFYTNKRMRCLYIVGCVIALGIGIRFLMNIEMFQALYKDSFENLINFVLKGETVKEISLNSRFEMMLAGLKMWTERPLFGYGLGTFSEIGGYGTYSHSDYVELLFGVGIIGAGIYYSLLGISMIRLIKSRKVHNINTCTAVAIGAVLLLANISAILYNLFYILVYMLFIYKVVFFSNRKLMIVNGKYL